MSFTEHQINLLRFHSLIPTLQHATINDFVCFQGGRRRVLDMSGEIPVSSATSTATPSGHNPPARGAAGGCRMAGTFNLVRGFRGL